MTCGQLNISGPSFKIIYGDFHGDPVVRLRLHAYAGGMGLILGQGAKMPHAAKKIYLRSFKNIYYLLKNF